MGPDCGTALIAGVPLAFANAVPRGDIGIVAASGTGLQEVSCLLARLGAGVSHGIGVGGRDLDERVGALGTLAAIDALGAGCGNRGRSCFSRSRPRRAWPKRCSSVSRSPKRSVVCFLGLDKPASRTLHEAAEMATGKEDRRGREAKRGGSAVVWKALYCGGTLCSEAELIFRRRGLAGHRFVDLGDDRFTRAAGPIP